MYMQCTCNYPVTQQLGVYYTLSTSLLMVSEHFLGLSVISSLGQTKLILIAIVCQIEHHKTSHARIEEKIV